MDDLFETVADGALGKPTESISLAGGEVLANVGILIELVRIR